VRPAMPSRSSTPDVDGRPVAVAGRATVAQPVRPVALGTEPAWTANGTPPREPAEDAPWNVDGNTRYRGRRRRAGSIPLRVAAVLGVGILVIAGSVFAYANWGRSDGPRQQADADKAPAAAGVPRARQSRPAVVAPPATGYVPYLDAQYDPPINLASTARLTGIRQFLLGFIIAGNGCTPTWGGDQPIGEEEIVARVKALRAVGGDVRLSFGGAAGTELAAACNSPTALAAAYQKAIDTYSATKIDFDIEGNELGNAASTVRRSQAIAILERNAAAAGRALNVSATLPVNPNGLTFTPLRVLRSAAISHATIHVINVMAMDFGSDVAPDPAGRMGTYAIGAMTAAHAAVMRIFGLSATAAWQRIAVTPLIGVNDPPTEVFTVADARKLGAFARSKHAAFVSMWAVTRDRPCPPGETADAESDHCAGNAPSAYAFSRAFLG
jgi:hypothetical protein